jgi:hypothetical protein
MRQTQAMAAAALAAAGLLAGCQPRIKVDPIKIEPVQITMDINIRVDKQLDQFFDFEAPATKDGAGAAGGETGKAKN